MSKSVSYEIEECKCLLCIFPESLFKYILMTQNSCNTAGLNPYVPSANDPWDEVKIKHFYRRVGIDPSPQQITEALQQNPQEWIDTIINLAEKEPPAPAPVWGFWPKKNFDNSDEINYYLARRELSQTICKRLEAKGLRERMAMFWKNHFVTQWFTYQSSAYSYQYYSVLEKNAMGDFREMTSEIGLTAPMLIYLNGNQNKKGRPNENYARELYELFTLGENNGYTQRDIEETAKALTGYTKKVSNGGPIIFEDRRFDTSDKTIFGQTGNWGYDDVIRIVFETHPDRIANFIAKKIYHFFVSPVDPDPGLITELGKSFKDANFQITPMLRLLLKSEHFFDTSTIGVVVKSPLDLLVGMLSSTGMKARENYNIYLKFHFWLSAMGQELFNPPDVAGWQRDRSWITTSSIVNRWKLTGAIVDQFWRHDREQFRTFALAVAGDSKDPKQVTRAIMDHLLAQELPNASEYDAATDIFKGDVPENYFEDGIWSLYFQNATEQVRDLLKHITRIPEFQLK